MSQKTRIAFIIGGIGLGGAERQLLNFLKHCDKNRFDLHLIVLNHVENYSYDEQIEAMGIPLYYCPEIVNGIIKRMLWIREQLSAIRPDIVHSWSFHTNPYAAICGFLAGVPIWLGSHRNHPDHYERNLNSIFRWLGYRGVHGIVVNSKHAKEVIYELKLRSHNVFEVSNGIELADDTERPDLTQFDIPESARLIATIGNLQRRKNQRMFIEVCAKIMPQFPDAYALIIGQTVPNEPGMDDILQKQIDDLGLRDKVFLTGVRNDIPAILRRTDLLCLTSITEGTPNVVLETMAAAKPVIVTAVGGLPDIIEDGINGYLVDLDDVSAMAERVRILLIDDDLRASIGHSAYNYVGSNFSCQQMARNLEAVYDKMLS